jgi:hypothetical protein
MNEGKYILQDRDGDYVLNVENAKLETIKVNFTFTKDKRKAKRFTFNDLWSKLSTNPVGEQFTKGFGGGRAIPV